MPHIVTKTHFEYNDETYTTPDAHRGKEPGVPVASFDTKEAAVADQWEREIAAWFDNDQLGCYVSNIEEAMVDARYSSEKHIEKVNKLKTSYAEITGMDVNGVEFGYEFELPSDLSEEQVRKVIELFKGPHFYNVFEV